MKHHILHTVITLSYVHIVIPVRMNIRSENVLLQWKL